jgi:hypothetical protein
MNQTTAIKKLAIQLVIFLQGCRARLPGKAAGQGCRARLPGKAARQVCRARLPGKSAGQGCRPRLHAMVEYAKSMVKLDNNAVFRKKKNNKAKLRPSLYLRTNAGKN